MTRYLTHRFETLGGSPVTAKVPAYFSNLADFFECDENAIDFIETDDGNEIVTINGEAVGTVEFAA